MLSGEVDQLSARWPDENGSPVTRSAPIPLSLIVVNAASTSLMLLAPRTVARTPRLRAAVSATRFCEDASTLLRVYQDTNGASCRH